MNMESRAQAMHGPGRIPFATEAQLAASYEARAAAMADSVSLVSEVDRTRARALQRAAVILIGVDQSAFPFAEPSERDPVLVFFGNLGYFHNLEPVRRAAREVLPRLRARLRRASLRIVGARPTPAVARLEQVPGAQLVGPVERIVDELHRAAVALLPIVSGSGMQNKLLEAFSAGTPVVTTRAAIRPIPAAQPGRHCLVGETADELADACAALMTDRDLRVRIAREARELADRHYGVEGQADALLELYGRR